MEVVSRTRASKSHVAVGDVRRDAPALEDRAAVGVAEAVCAGVSRGRRALLVVGLRRGRGASRCIPRWNRATRR